MKMALPLMSLFLLAFTPKSNAQEEIYRVELGGMAGGCFYLGDANYTGLYKNTRPMGGFLARYKFNPRLSLKASIAAGGIKGDLTNTKNQYPADVNGTFSRTVYDIGLAFEVGLWPYGIGPEYLNYKRWQPYFSIAIGSTYAPKPEQSILAANLPIGIGIKYKIKSRWNVGVEFTAHFSTTDKLDVTKAGENLEDPYHIQSGFLKNKDSYCFTSFFITYDLFPQCQNCNKLEE